MSDDDTGSSFKLDLDSDDFMSKGQDALGVIQEIGNSENLAGLSEALIGMAPLIGAVGVAVLAFKEGFDAAFDAEKVAQVNAEFDALTTNAGVMGETLKNGLVESAHGWADQTTLIGAANKAMIGLQAGVEQLPQVMGLARQATMVFGGDLTQNFETITNAVEAGNVRMLRHLGIIIDQKKAYDTYAHSIGVSADVLSKAGQQQALMNAVLEQGAERFKGVSDNVTPATNAWRELKTAMVEFGETLNNIIGPAMAGHMSGFFSMMKNGLESTSTWLKATFGSGTAQADAGVKLLNDRIADTKKKLDDIEQKKGFGATLTAGEATIQVQQLTAQLTKLEAEYGKATAAKKKLDDDKPAARTPAAGPDAPGGAPAQMVDLKKQEENKKKYNEEMQALDKKITAQQIEDMTTVEQADKLYNQQRLEAAAVYEKQIKAVQAQEKEGTITKAQGDAQIVKLDQLKTAALETDETKLQEMRAKALDNYAQKSDTVFQGIGRSFASMSEKNSAAMMDFGQIGEKTAQTFGSHMTSAFSDIGSGSKTATQALGSAFSGMAGDMATNYGQVMLLASVWPPNPLGLAGGAALIALGGLLGSLGGSNSSASTAGSPATSGGGFAGTTANPANPTSSSTPTPGSTNTTNQGNTVSLIVQGNMLTDQNTANWIVQQVRNASDQGNFTSANVKGGF